MGRPMVKDLMSPPRALVAPHDTLAYARDEMRRAGVHHVPVVDGTGALVGLVSELDLDRVMGLMAAAEGLRQPLTVGDIVGGRQALRATPEQPAHEAAAMLIASHTDGLPVVDDAGKLVGILTSTDLLEVARKALLGIEPVERAGA